MASKLEFSEIAYGELKGGARGVMLGEENLFLEVTHGRAWKLRLVDLFTGEPLTAWATIHDLEDLRSAWRTKAIRECLKKRWENYAEIIEKALVEIQEHEGEWLVNEDEDEEKSGEKFDEEIMEKARNLLRDPAFFYKLGWVFRHGFVVSKLNKPRFVIGEERNKRLLGPLLIGASKLGMTSIIRVLGETATAKDTMLRMWLDLLPVKSVERGYVTAASLRYSKQMKRADLLYIPESPELRGEMGRHLRLMRADDGGLISEYATRDKETGEMVTKVVRLPVKGVVTTSDAITGDPALESGAWTLRTNESEELTRKVKEEKLKLWAGGKQLFPEEELKVWKCAFKILVSEELPGKLPQIPYAEHLIGLLESGKSRSRRDPDKLCALISLMAWIRRFQKNVEGRDEADLIDLYYALQIGLDAITQTISELDEKEQLIFETVKDAMGEDYVTVRYVTQETKIPYETCYKYLERLVEKGFLNKDKERGRNVYSVLNETAKKLFVSQTKRYNSPKELMGFVLNSVKNSSTLHREEDIIFIDPLTGDEVKVSIREDGEPDVTVENKIYAYPYDELKSSERSMETPLKQEKEPKQLFAAETKRDLETPRRTRFLYRRIPPAEKCEVCGELAVEYEITTVEGLVLRRCGNCFDRMRLLSNVEWVEESEL